MQCVGVVALDGRIDRRDEHRVWDASSLGSSQILTFDSVPFEPADAGLALTTEIGSSS